MKNQKFVILGAGHASGLLVQTLAKKGIRGGVTLISDEPYGPYQRPPLSKKYLSDEMSRDGLMLQKASFFEDFNYEFLSGQRAVSIDREQACVKLENGASVAYDKLAICTGTRARTLPIRGIDLAGVHYLRTIEDVEAIRAQWAEVESLVVVGGGFIGLEVAAVARKMGKAVTIVEMQDRLMPRVVAPIVSDFYKTKHESQGVRIHLNSRVSEIIGEDGHVKAVVSGDTKITTQMVIVGIGVIANDEIADTAGLQCDQGIVVDQFCQTSDQDIVAAGDCTRHFNPLYERYLRLESVHNAVEQGKAAAAHMIGQPVEYAQIPWFWSDQYNLKLQMVGLSEGYDDTVLRGSLAEHQFSLFYYRGEDLIAVDSINRPADHLFSRKLLNQKICLSKSDADDENFDFKSLL